jgi:hypothetical protein
MLRHASAHMWNASVSHLAQTSGICRTYCFVNRSSMRPFSTTAAVHLGLTTRTHLYKLPSRSRTMPPWPAAATALDCCAAAAAAFFRRFAALPVATSMASWGVSLSSAKGSNRPSSNSPSCLPTVTRSLQEQQEYICDVCYLLSTVGCLLCLSLHPTVCAPCAQFHLQRRLLQLLPPTACPDTAERRCNRCTITQYRHTSSTASLG